MGNEIQSALEEAYSLCNKDERTTEFMICYMKESLDYLGDWNEDDLHDLRDMNTGYEPRLSSSFMTALV